MEEQERIDQILEAYRDSDFHQRILRRIDHRQHSGLESRMTLSKTRTSELFWWLRKSIEHQVGRVIGLPELEEIL